MATTTETIFSRCNTSASNSAEQNHVEELCRCVICYQQMEGATLTPCGHRFCAHCLHNWIESHRNCPVCRADLSDDELIEDSAFNQLITAVQEAGQGQIRPDGRERATVFTDVCHCYICSNELEGSLITLCGHRFCAHCIYGWITSFSTCPVCNHSICEDEIIREPRFDELKAVLSSRLGNNHSVTTSSRHANEVSGELDKLRADKERLQNEVERLQFFEQKCAIQEAELKRINTKILPQKQAQINTLAEKVSQLQQLTADNKCLQNEVDRLRSLEQKCTDQEAELKKISTIILPGKQEELKKLQESRLVLEKQYQAMPGVELQYLKGIVIPEKEATIRRLEEELKKLQEYRQGLENQGQSMYWELQYFKGNFIPEKEATIKRLEEELQAYRQVL